MPIISIKRTLLFTPLLVIFSVVSAWLWCLLLINNSASAQDGLKLSTTNTGTNDLNGISPSPTITALPTTNNTKIDVSKTLQLTPTVVPTTVIPDSADLGENGSTQQSVVIIPSSTSPQLSPPPQQTSISQELKPIIKENNTQAIFFVNPVSEVADDPVIVFKGTKPGGTAVFLNSDLVVTQNSDTNWSFKYLLSVGRNKLNFENKDGSGKIVGSSTASIIYQTTNGKQDPILNVIKDNVDVNTKNEIEKKVEKETSAKNSPEDAVSLSKSSLQNISRILDQNSFSYLTPHDGSTFLNYLLHQDSKNVFTQTFGGPKISSPTHPNQNTWYSNNDVEVNWEKLDTAVSYYIGLANHPVEPDTQIGADINNWIFKKVVDGVWYFSVKARVNGGVSLTNFYRIQINTTQPQLREVKVANPFNSFKNGSLVILNIKFSQSVLRVEDVAKLPEGLPVAFMDETDLKNSELKRNFLPDYSRIVETDFSALDTNFKKERVMYGKPQVDSNSDITFSVSYRISANNKRTDSKEIPVLVSIKDFVGNKSYGTINVSLDNKISPIRLTNIDDLSNSIVKPNNVNPDLTLKGVASPNSTVVLMIYSDNPKTITVTTDNDGNWTYKLMEPLEIGNHTVYSYIKSLDAKTENIVQVASFSLVSEAQAKEIKEISKPLIYFKPVTLNVPGEKTFIPPLPLAIKLALVLYILSFGSLVAALVVWYKENPPSNY